jgi:hypothetical protein
MLSSMDCF